MKILLFLSFFVVTGCQSEVYNDIYWNDDDSVNSKEKVSSDEELPVFDRDDEKPNKVNVIEE